MNTPGENDIWTPPRLRARLAAQKGLAPAPSCYVIWRATSRVGAPEARGYELPDHTGRRDEAAFERWLVERNLAGPERLSVSVLVIREQLDESGVLRDCVLERRRGGVDGPYYGNVARVEFAGAARMVRRYRASPDGRLTELPVEDATGVTPPPASVEAESFAGEDTAVHEYLGQGSVILDRRAPTLFEELVGLSGVIHARRPDGVEVGCGVGWHGGVAFVVVADFPRFGRPLSPPPELEAGVESAAKTRDLIPYETRLDEQGFCVIARERGRRTLVAIRQEGKATRIDPYVPGRVASANEEQRRWMTYAETYEARTILDSWRDGDSDNIAVLTIDPEQEAWRHIIDRDGVEVSRQSDNDAAAAVLYRERLSPPDEAPVTPEPHAASVPPDTVPWLAATAPDREAPADSLLTTALAWSRVTGLLSAAIVAGAPGRSAGAGVVLDLLRAMVEPLTVMHASVSAGSLRQLIAQTEAGTLAGQDFAVALDDLVTRLRDELAASRIVTLPSVAVTSDGEPPFGALVEQHFPAAAYDIEEAVRCLALRRSTAAAQHAAKVLRAGVSGIERLLARPRLTGLSWARLIAAVRGGTGEYGDLVEALIRVRRAWRAPGLAPADKYTEEEAEAVLAAVEGLMRLLAARLDAAGDAGAD
jgi:hypothetical protein